MTPPDKSPPVSPENHIDSLHRRGMQIPDPEGALHFVRNIGTGLLGEYLPPLEDDGRFCAGASFDDITNLYHFDRKLRLLVMDGAGVVEVSVRARMFSCGALTNWEEARKQLTMGKLSRHYRDTPRALRRQIANCYEMSDAVLASFLHHLTTVRNLCAHHRRLWNHHFDIWPRLPRPPRFPAAKPKPQPFFHFNFDAREKLYNTLVILVYLTELISPSIGWRRRLRGLLTAHDEIRQNKMGFPPDWHSAPFWREKA